MIYRASDEYRKAMRAGDDGRPDWQARNTCNLITAAVDVSIYFIERCIITLLNQQTILIFGIDFLLPSSAQSSSAEMVFIIKFRPPNHPTTHPPGESKQIYCNANLLQHKFTATQIYCNANLLQRIFTV